MLHNNNGTRSPYNLRSRKRARVDEQPDSTTTTQTTDTSSPKRKKLRPGKQFNKNTQELWKRFNQYISAEPDGPEEFYKEFISATSVKNYLLKDPLLDWLKLHYLKRGLNNNVSPICPQMIALERTKVKKALDDEQGQLATLFDMGNRYEDEVVAYLRKKYPGQVERVSYDNKRVVPQDCERTFIYMKAGTPIIEQAALYNMSNKTWGVADLLIRSDWLNRIFNRQILTPKLATRRASNLTGNYHYVVIDIKWTTLPLRSNGTQILNSQRFPAYKGQLAIYNAAVGLLQGYTPDKAYILAKSWKYTECSQKYDGYNSFDTLGEIDYSDFDQNYIEETRKAIAWVREVRYHGHNWSCVPPSRLELRPNMCNGYDSPYHEIKKEISEKQDEITSIWMVGVKHRNTAVERGVSKWSDPKCTAKMMDITGEKIGPTVDAILDINRSTQHKIRPQRILNNNAEWQTESEFDFYVDFETVNGCFYDHEINVTDSKQENGIIFLVGVGYVENNSWNYKSFLMNDYTVEEEKRVIHEFIDFIEDRVTQKLRKYKISKREYVRPNLFCWGHAERSMFRNADKRHCNIWTKWTTTVNWMDFCKVFVEEPITIKGAKKFNLKEITNTMHKNGMIKCQWNSDGPSTGLGAMIEAARYYKFMEEWNKLDPPAKKLTQAKHREYIDMMAKVIEYNEVDCRAVYEIVSYLRKNHC